MAADGLSAPSIFFERLLQSVLGKRADAVEAVREVEEKTHRLHEFQGSRVPTSLVPISHCQYALNG